MAGAERRAAHVPGAAELVADYDAWCAVDGHGSVCYRNAAWAFLGCWPDPSGFAVEPLGTQLRLTASQRPFVTFLMLTGRLRPGYDYLAHRKIGGLLAQAGRSWLADDIIRFTTAATDLDYGGHAIKRISERVLIRTLIQTGKSLEQLTRLDLDDLAAAMRRYAEGKGNRTGWVNDRGLVLTAHRVLFHLGVLPTPPEDPRRRPGLTGYYSGVPEPMRSLFLDYCTQRAATHAPATVKGTASHLAAFGRFLASCDPPVLDLPELDRATIEAWLACLAQARREDGAALSIGHRRGQILTVRQFLTDTAEWGWSTVPTRRLIFSRDLPRLPHPLPRYLIPATPEPTHRPGVSPLSE
ncbi:MAG: hypothetical protein WCG47_21915 [Dermatophilaceae bacterium]